MTSLETAQKRKQITAQSGPLLTSAVRKAFAAIRNEANTDDILPPLGQYEKDIEEILECITTGSNPAEYFTPISHGAFKECYALNHSANYVIKFCSQWNPTQDEIGILDASESFYIRSLFIPSYFIPFHGFTCPVQSLEEVGYDHESRYAWDEKKDDYVEDPEWEAPYFNYAIIQPRIAITCDEDPLEEGDWYVYSVYRPQGESTKNRRYLHDSNNTIIPYHKVSNIDINSYSWLTAVISRYGEDTVYLLNDFITEYQISDLSLQNIGYIRNKYGHSCPIIIDWMSRN